MFNALSKLIVPVIAFCTMSAYALTEDESTVTVYQSGKVSKVLNLAQLKQSKLQSKPPHRALNPEGKVNTYDGVSFEQIADFSRLKGSDKIHLIGVDGYISTIPLHILKNHGNLIALKENGKDLSHRQGGLQLVFDTVSNKEVPKPYAEKAAFWCWYIKSIVIGDLPTSSILKSQTKNQESKPFNLTPPSVFEFEETKCPELVTVQSKSSISSIKLLSGETKNPKSESYELIVGKNNKPFPVNCGGPIALVEKSKKPADGKSFRAHEIITGVISLE